MPAYSTWQPTEGSIPPMASADQNATRRLVDPRGDSLRGNPIVSTLLGFIGGPSNPSVEGGITAVGESIPGPARPTRLADSDRSRRGRPAGRFDPVPVRSGPLRSSFRRGRRVLDSIMESAESPAAAQ